MNKLLLKVFIVFIASGFTSAFASAVSKQWRYDETVDPMTDEVKASFAYIVMDGTRSGPLITVHCGESGKLSIVMSTGKSVGFGKFPVMYRVDGKKAVDAGDWYANGKGAIVPDSLRAEVVSHLINGSEIIFQIKSNDGSKSYQKFPLRGSAAVIKKLSCLDQEFTSYQ